jgi:colanic acid/amylovoran biosynthesis glycosyltransferase
VSLCETPSDFDKAPPPFEIHRPCPKQPSRPSSQPVVASYCATFLKPEMLHIYRQVTGLRRYKTFVVTRERLEERAFPFPDIELMSPTFSLKRFYLKYVRKMPPLCYRGEFQQLMELFRRRHRRSDAHLFRRNRRVFAAFYSKMGRPVRRFIPRHGYPASSLRRPDMMTACGNCSSTAPLVLARSESLLAGLERLGCPREKLRLNRTGIPLDQFSFRQRDWFPRMASGVLCRPAA